MDLGGALLDDLVARIGLGQCWLMQHLDPDVVICHGPNLVAVSAARVGLSKTPTICVWKYDNL
jgi:hypothetical protein